MSYSRFAIYYVQPDGPLADFGAAWLGWNIARGHETPQCDVPGLREITQAPRKYGFHATLKPPFRLAQGSSLDALQERLSTFSAACAPARCDGLALRPLGRFLALTPQGDTGAVRALAGQCVRTFDAFRAPATDAELARRRKGGLSVRQQALLDEWGYPYVMEEFRFHMTLSDRLPRDDIPVWADIVAQHLPTLPSPFVLDQIALCGERADGQFEMIHRYALTG